MNKFCSKISNPPQNEANNEWRISRFAMMGADCGELKNFHLELFHFILFLIDFLIWRLFFSLSSTLTTKFVLFFSLNSINLTQFLTLFRSPQCSCMWSYNLLTQLNATKFRKNLKTMSFGFQSSHKKFFIYTDKNSGEVFLNWKLDRFLKVI